MASKKAGRLAGLATLAGLAYMNKDKLFGAKDKTPDAAKSESKSESKSKSYDRDTDTGVDVMPSYAAKKEDTSGNAAMYEKEPGFETKTTPAKVASVVKAPSASVTKATPVRVKSMDELMSSYKPRRPDTRIEDAELKDNTGKRIKRYEDDGGRSMAARQSPVTEDEGLKRGGKVKKMASGGMTSSASKRADGIAQRGKTRGKVY